MDYMIKLLEEYEVAANQSQGAAQAENLSMRSATAPQYWQLSDSARQQGLNTLVNVNPSPLKIPSVVHHLGNNASVQEPVTGQKKRRETSTLPSSRKKQKVSKESLDLNIERLNDVTATSGINLGQEEEYLVSGFKKNSYVSKASRRVVQEEEEKLILQRGPLQKKLEGIMLKCGITCKSNNVEQCLSMCVEERVRQLITNLVIQSKQRTESKKPKGRSFITSDISQQILLLNQKSKEEWGKKQGEIGRMHKLRKIESESAIDGGEEKEGGHGIAYKAKKEENKIRTEIANAAARAAVGGNDMLSKWQLMAKQAPRKHGVSSVALSSSRPSSSKRSPNKLCDTNTMCSSGGVAPGSARKHGKAQAAVAPARVEQTLSVKDVIAVLEKEPQMSKSPLLYGLYSKVHNTNSSTEQPGDL